jgi:BASS family bile acid:Na+ symporter
MGQTARSLFNSDASAWIIALGGLMSCVVQFILGKTIGSVYKDRISAGQALGQKNTVLAIWMASAYLHPLATIAPGSYVLWQNIINSYQLWKKRKKEV